MLQRSHWLLSAHNQKNNEETFLIRCAMNIVAAAYFTMRICSWNSLPSFGSPNSQWALLLR
jgi:hypothetical protein